MIQSGRNNNCRNSNFKSNHSPANPNHHQYHPKSHHYAQQQHPQVTQNQPLYGNLVNNYCNSNGKSNSIASYNSRQSAGQVSIGSQSSSTSSIPAANSTDIDSTYRNPLTIRRESSSSVGPGCSSSRVSPSVSFLLIYWHIGY